MKVAALTRRVELRTEEQNQLASFLEQLNRTQAAFPRDLTVSQVFTRQAASTPEASAVIYHCAHSSNYCRDVGHLAKPGFSFARPLPGASRETFTGPGSGTDGAPASHGVE